MFINSILMCQNSSKQKISQQHSAHSMPALKSNRTDIVSFTGGPNPEVLKNQLRMLLTQDIWAAKLKVKMPETPVEKEILLEVLENRSKLDKFARLTNEKVTLKNKINRLENLIETDPSNPDLPQLKKEIAKYGNIDSVLNTFDKKIELEVKKNKPAMDYFKNLQKVENEYWDKRLIKSSMMEKFWHKVTKNNINPEGKYSTKELIDIVSNDQAPVATQAAKIVSKPLSKKQLLAQIEKQYEQLLRETIDVYQGHSNHNTGAQNARRIVYEANTKAIKNFPDLQKQLLKTYNTIENKYTVKVNRLDNIDIYPIGEIWKDMKGVETSIKKTMQNIAKLENQLAKNPNDKGTKQALSSQEKSLKEMQGEWLKGLKHSVKYESINRERMTAAGRLPEYDYLAGENKTIKRHKEALEIFKNNNNSIPENLWSNVLG